MDNIKTLKFVHKSPYNIYLLWFLLIVKVPFKAISLFFYRLKKICYKWFLKFLQIMRFLENTLINQAHQDDQDQMFPFFHWSYSLNLKFIILVLYSLYFCLTDNETLI